MTSLTMMGLTPGLLVHAILLFALKNPLVMLTTLLVVLTTPLAVLAIPLIVFVAWGITFFF